MIILLALIFSSMTMSQDFEKVSCDISNHHREEFINFSKDTENVIKYFDEKSKNKYSYRCDLSTIENKEEYIIAIDGSNSFTPVEFELSRLRNIKEEGESFAKLLNDEDNKVLEVYNKEAERKSYSPMTNLMLTSKTKLNKSQESLYFSHMNPIMIRKCIKEIKKIKPNMKIKIISYSWGGNTTQKVINKLEKDNIQIESVLMIDPVRKGFLATGVIKNITGKKNSSFFRKNKNVKKLVSIYQKSKERVLGFIAIRGNPIVDADKNINLSNGCKMKRFFNSKTLILETPKLSHLNLNFCQETRDEYDDFILN